MPDEIPIVNPDGTFSENWHESFPEEYHPTLTRFKKFDDLVNSHIATKKMTGLDPKRTVEIPADDADEETKSEFWKKLGVTDVADYKFERGEGLSERSRLSDEDLAYYANLAREAHMTPEAFNKWLNGHFKLMEKKVDDYELIRKDQEQKIFENAEKAMKKMYGEAYDIRIARTNVVLGKYAKAEVKDEDGKVIGTVGELLDEQFPGLKNSPLMTMLIDGIAGDMSEGRLKKLTGATEYTADDIEDEIAKIRADPNYMDDSNPRAHKAVLDKMSKLYEQKAKKAG